MQLPQSVQDADSGEGRALDGTPVNYRRIGYVPEFDGIRGVALLIVVISHTSVLYPSGRWLAIPGGFLALDMFFVLSGFLITALMLREQAETRALGVVAFYRRRMLRLLPALFVLLAAHWLYSAIVRRPADIERATLLSAAFYYANWKLAAGQPFVMELKHLWSLSVEEQFYLAWPFVVALVLPLRRRLSIIISVLISAVILVAIHRAILWQNSGVWDRIYVRTDARAEGLLLGSLLAHVWVRGVTPARGVSAAAWAAAAFLGYCLFFSQPQDATLYRGLFTVIAFAWVAIILAMLESDWPVNALLRLPALRALGRVSYGCYLWHLPVFVVLGRSMPHWPSHIRIAAALSATALATYLSWVLVERRFLRISSSPSRYL